MHEINRLEDTIKEKISLGNVKIKPKWHFALKSALVITLALISVLMTTLMLSFMVFKERMLPPHEMREVIMNIRVLPYIIILLLTFLLSIVLVLHTKYNFIYRNHMYIIISILLTVMLGFTFVSDKLLIHDRMRDMMNGKNIKYIYNPYKDEMLELRIRHDKNEIKLK